MCFGMTQTGQTKSYENKSQLQQQLSNLIQQQQQRQQQQQSQLGTSSQATTSRTELPQWLQDAAQQNYQFARGIAEKPFQAYTGERVAGLTPDQMQAAGMVRNLASSGNAYLPGIEQMYGAYGAAPAGKVSSPSILGGGYDAASGSINDYLNPYLQGALAPQLRNIERAGAVMRTGPGGIDSGATSAGAFGDARHGVETAEQMRNQAQLESDVTGQAYKDAFDRAATLRGTDVTNLINTGTTNAGLNEQALARMLGSGNAFMGLDKYNTGRGVDLANALNQYGTQARGVDQARMDAAFQEFMRGQQDPYTKLQALMQSLQGASGNVNRTTTGQTTGQTTGLTQGSTDTSSFGSQQGQTQGMSDTTTQGLKQTYAPNNAGWGLAGTILGSLLGGPVGGSIGGSLANLFGGGGMNPSPISSGDIAGGSGMNTNTWGGSSTGGGWGSSSGGMDSASGWSNSPAMLGAPAVAAGLGQNGAGGVGLGYGGTVNQGGGATAPGSWNGSPTMRGAPTNNNLPPGVSGFWGETGSAPMRVAA
jgi:hypothetical protein